MRTLTCLLTLGLAIGLPTTAAAAEPEDDGSEASASVSLGGDSSASADGPARPADTDNVYMGAEVSRVASSFEDDDIFDVHFGVGYDFTFKRAAILREWNSGGAGDTQNRLVKDLMYRQLKHTITPTLELGLWHDLAVYLTMPVILSDSRDYSFDQRVDDCVFGDQANATCTNKDNSTTIRDSIIPRDGFDATSSSPGTQFTGSGTELIFRGPQRRGLDQLHVGVKYGILNQKKRSHMPNWIIAGEGRFAIGRAQTFRRDIVNGDPSGNQRVGRRIHEIGAWTALSRRYRFLDPYFVGYWRQSLRAGNSAFQDFSQFGQQDDILPQSTAGVTIGSEIVPFERKSRNIKLALDVSGTAILHYGGRAYSEVWELLADSPSLAGSFDPTNSCDRDLAIDFASTNPGDPGYLAAGGESCQPFEGITEVQDYGSFGFNAGLNLHLSQYFRINLGTRLMTDTRHFVTFAKRGDAAGGNDPDRVEPGTREVNPVRRDVVDNVGRRYAVDDVINFDVFLRVLATF